MGRGVGSLGQLEPREWCGERGPVGPWASAGGSQKPGPLTAVAVCLSCRTLFLPHSFRSFFHLGY